jgi:cytochrome c553
MGATRLAHFVARPKPGRTARRATPRAEAPCRFYTSDLLAARAVSEAPSDHDGGRGVEMRERDSQALACASCHGGTRLDFAALGYTPLATRNGKPLCGSCNSSKSGSFTFIHDKHVTDKKLDCIDCHTFAKA